MDAVILISAAVSTSLATFGILTIQVIDAYQHWSLGRKWVKAGRDLAELRHYGW